MLVVEVYFVREILSCTSDAPQNLKFYHVNNWCMNVRACISTDLQHLLSRAQCHKDNSLSLLPSTFGWSFNCGWQATRVKVYMASKLLLARGLLRLCDFNIVY